MFLQILYSFLYKLEKFSRNHISTVSLYLLKTKKRTLFIMAIIIVILWILLAFCFPIDKVNAPEFDEDNSEILYCNDGSICPIETE